MKRMIKKGLRNYRVTLLNGALIFVRARISNEAIKLAKDEMMQEFGKVKAIKSVTEVTKEDMEKYPMFFSKSWQNPGIYWHVDRAKELRKWSDEYHARGLGNLSANAQLMAQENELAADASRKLGIHNPIKKSSIVSIILIAGLCWLICRNKQ